MRFGGEGVLLFAGDAVFCSDHLRGCAHVEVVVCVPQAVVDHRVDESAVAHAIAGAGLREQIGRVGHRLHAAGDDDFRVACLDGLGGERDGAKTRAADLIHGEGAGFGRDAGVDGSLTGRVLAEAGLQDAAHDALVNEFSLEWINFTRGRCRP